MGLLVLTACAPAVPLLGGGTLPPEGRGDVAVGGAARFSYGELRELEALALGEPLEDSDVQPSGVSPVVQGRYGLTQEVSLGLTATGAQVALDVGLELWADETSSYRPSLRLRPLAYVAPIGAGQRVGGDLPLLLAFDVSSVVGLWAGPRVGLESAFGDVGGQALHLLGVRLGGVLGLAFGFKDVHGLVELTVAHERWSGTVSASGVALSPAFALRLRI